MARNIEIKARVSPPSLSRIRDHALALSTAAPVTLQHTDTFFNAPRGRLKLREFAGGGAELIGYERPERCGPALSSYIRYECRDPGSLRGALARTLGIRGMMAKRRQVIMIGQTRVHLDDVEGLGTFIELEVILDQHQSLAEGERIAAGLMDTLGLEPGSLVDAAYVEGSP